LEVKKYTHGTSVYKEGEKANNIFIVKKGEFELVKRLPRVETHVDRQFNPSNIKGSNSYKSKHFNILAKRLPEIRDLPYHMKLSIAGVGSLLGEEDVFSRT
jgi:CRP-like cAMP-binding protein